VNVWTCNVCCVYISLIVLVLAMMGDVNLWICVSILTICEVVNVWTCNVCCVYISLIVLATVG
jgi:hypothetical protein